MTAHPDETFSSYNALAPYYNLVYAPGSQGRAPEIALAKGMIQAYHPYARSVLDLGTGTGAILKGLEEVVAERVGLDNSVSMLEVARREVPEAEFIEADMSDFQLDRKFDVILCLFDSINHLQDLELWRNLFRRTEQHLEDNGVFIFDIATSGLIRRLATRERSNTWPIEGGSYNLDVEQIDANHFVSHFIVSLDGADSAEPRHITGDIPEATYPVEDIRAAASEYLQHLLDFDTADFLIDGFAPATDESRRPVFLYEKPQP